MFRRSITIIAVLSLFLAGFAASPLQASSHIFLETSGFATKTGFRFVFAWEATQPIIPQVEYGTDPGNLDGLATPIPPGIADTAGMALADEPDLVGQTIHWRVRDLVTNEVSSIKSFEAKNAYTAWDPVTQKYTINLLVQLDSQSLPPELTPDLALQDIFEGMNVFAERLYDMLDGHVKLGEVLITDTTTDYNGALPFLVNFVNLDECVPATTNVADVIVSTAQPFASQTFAWAIDDACQAFVVGRLGQLVIPWTDDLHLGGVSAHELGHYAFGAPDLYGDCDIAGTECAPDDGVPSCRNVAWDGSMMHNSGGWNGAIWELTELDRNPTTTPCDHEGEPYSWDVLRTRYTNIPPAPATGPVGFGIDHIFDPLPRGNEDGGMLHLCILDREPGASTYSCRTPDDGEPLPPGEPCVEPGVLIMSDAAGDFTTVAGTDGHDIRELRIAEPNDIGDGNVVFTLQMESLDTVPPSSAWPIQFTDQDGVVRWVRMDTVNGTPVPAFTYGTGGQSAVTNPGTPADPQSSFDADGTIRIVVPRTAIGNPQPGQALSQFLVRVRIEPGLTPDNMPDSLNPAGGYTIIGSENCISGNLPPVATDDPDNTTNEDTSVVISVLDNDSDPDGDTLSVSNVASPTKGTATTDGTTVEYTPNTNFFGVDSFTYTASDGKGGFDQALVTVTVDPVNDPPTANDDDAVTVPETGVEIDVLANDFDPEGDPIFIDSFTQGGDGAVTDLNPSDGSLTYTPDLGFSGTDTFTYDVSDGTDSDTATVTITVIPAECTVSVLEDVEGDPDAIIDEEDAFDRGWSRVGTVDLVDLVWYPHLDALATSPVRSWFSPAVNPTAKDDRLISPQYLALGTTELSFWHRFYLDEGFDGGILEVSTNDGTTWQKLDSEITTGGYNVVMSDLIDNALDSERAWSGSSHPDGYPVSPEEMTYVTVDLSGFVGQNIRIAWRAVNDNLAPPFPGIGWWVDDITFANVVDPDCDINNPPIALDDEAETDEDTPVTIVVLTNDSDPDGDALTVTGASNGSNGTTVVNGDNTVTYTPNPNYNGPDSFTYTINDGNGATDQAIVLVTVNPINDPPVAENDFATTDEDTSVIVDVLANDSDVEGDTLTIISVSDPPNGSVVNTGTSLTYTPDANYHGGDAFTYTISDGNGGEDTAVVNITVNPINDAPVANDDEAATERDTSVDIDVLDNDFDVDGDTLTVSSVSDPPNGMTTNNGDGTVTYTPDPGFTGVDTFSYEVCDTSDVCDQANVDVTVTHPVPEGGGKVTGGGYLFDGDGEKINFGFNAQENPNGLQGNLQLSDKTEGVKIHGKELLALGRATGSCGSVGTGQNAMEFWISGSFNKTDGAEFRVCVEDNGEPGNSGPSSDPDLFFLECLTGCTYDTGSRTPDDVIDGGNIQIHEPAAPPEGATEGSAGGGAESPEGGSGASVLVLDPVLLTSAPRGAPQALTVVAYGSNGETLAGVELTLTWTNGRGGGKLTGKTGPTGHAVFLTTVPKGVTEYTAFSGSLGSNAVEITGS